MDLKELPKSELVQKFQGYKDRIQKSRVRERAREKVQMGVGVLVGGASAYGTGWQAKRYPKFNRIGQTNLDSHPVAAGVLVTAGIFEAAGDQSYVLVDAGRGVLDGYAALKGFGAL